MTALNISKRKIYKRRRDGQVAQGTGGSGYASSFSASGSDASDPWLKVEVPRLDKLTIDANGNLLVPGNVIAFADMGGEYGTIFDNLPLASATSKGVAQFSDTFFTVVNGVVTINEGVTGLDEIALATYLTNNQYATQAWVTAKNYLTAHQSLAGYATEAWVNANFNKYVHPASHAATMITQDATHRFVTDTEKSAWNAKWNYNATTIAGVKVNNAYNSDKLGGVVASSFAQTINVWTKTATPNLDLLSVDAQGNLLVPGDIIAFADMGANYGSIFDNMPVASTTSKGVAQFSDVYFNVINGIVSINPGAVIAAETDPTVPAHVKAITSAQVSNWNTAYGWGNHAGLYLSLSGGSITGQLYSTHDGGAIHLNGIGAYAKFGSSGGGKSGVVGGKGTTDGGGLQYGTYWAYDSYWDESVNAWKANRTTLGKKWHVKMGYHTDAFEVFRYDGSVSSSWSDNDWVRVFKIEGGGNIVTSGYGTSSNWNTAYNWGNHASVGYYNSGNSNLSTVSWSTNELQAYGIIRNRSNFAVLNKAENGWRTWVTRNGSGGDVVMDLANIGSISASGTIATSGLFYCNSSQSNYQGLKISQDGVTRWQILTPDNASKNLNFYTYNDDGSYRKLLVEFVRLGDYVQFNGILNAKYGFNAGTLGVTRFSTNDTGTITTGNSIVSGYITASGEITAYSDMRLKHREKPFDNVLQNVTGLNVFYYSRLDIKGDRLSIGVSAQQIKNKWGEFVLEGGNTTLLNGTVIHKTLSVAYDKLGAAIAIQGLKEVKYWMDSTDRWKSAKDKEIERLSQRVSQLEKQLKAA